MRRPLCFERRWHQQFTDEQSPSATQLPVRLPADPVIQEPMGEFQKSYHFRKRANYQNLRRNFQISPILCRLHDSLRGSSDTVTNLSVSQILNF
mmetsp:Transcript_6154/g.15218  ORF Transcript_6154/g.15218 Transcript_6154/m.15218 type:complete len:94 (-) Transcript_6154:151-432(-)